MSRKENRYDIMMSSYPMLYAQRKLPMDETCMCWGIEAGIGWYEPLNKLSCKLERLNAFYSKYNLNVQASQVKEKYGTLRFYYDIVVVQNRFTKTIISLCRKAIKFITKHIKFKFDEIVDQTACVREEWDEISKEDYDSKKTFNYIKNKFGWKFKEEDGKYYRNCQVNYPKVIHWEIKNHKFLYWFVTKLKSFKTFLNNPKITESLSVIIEAFDSEVSELVTDCENECYKYCEKCGQMIGTSYSPRYVTKGWITYICKHCAEDLDSESYTIQSEKKDEV